jgi:hypothetical protein
MRQAKNRLSAFPSIVGDNFPARARDLKVLAICGSNRGLRHHHLASQAASDFVRCLEAMHYIDRGASITIGRRCRGGAQVDEDDKCGHEH